jgi:hypothetical protein
MPRLPRRARIAVSPRRSRVHDPGRHRHQHPRFRPFAAVRVAGSGIFVLALSGSVQMCVSGDVYAEYEGVISRPRFQRDEETIAATLRAIREQAFWVKKQYGAAQTPMTISFSNVPKRHGQIIS